MQPVTGEGHVQRFRLNLVGSTAGTIVLTGLTLTLTLLLLLVGNTNLLLKSGTQKSPREGK